MDGEFLPARSTADALDQKIPLFTGFLEYGNLKWKDSASLTLSSSDPLPVTVLGITGTIEIGTK